MRFDERVWDHITRKHGDKLVLSVDQLESSLGQENQINDRHLLVGFLKQCAGRKVGSFYNGRRGKPSRINWLRAPKLIPISEAVGGEPAMRSEAGVRTVTQELPIRPGVVAKLVVPEDLSPTEASRLAEFIKRIPVQAV